MRENKVRNWFSRLSNPSIYIYLSMRDIHLKSSSSLLIDERPSRNCIDLLLISSMLLLLPGAGSNVYMYVPSVLASIPRCMARFRLYTTSLHLINFIRSCYRIPDDVPRDARNVANVVKRFLENTKRAMGWYA